MKTIVTALVFALLLGGMTILPTPAMADVTISVAIGPPVLPVYPQPIIPGPGYLWTPGYWSYGPEGYFWVPGTWVIPPAPGLLWTPGYWGWETGYYYWHPGYWSPHVGYYGGIDYGYGYTGHGYHGGYWRGHDFYYNRSVNNVDVKDVHNTYVKVLRGEPAGERPSFSGGKGGVATRPNKGEQGFEREPRNQATAEQQQHRDTAHSMPGQRFSPANVNPAVAATRRPGGFSDNDTVRWNPARRGYGNANHNARSAPPRQHGGGHHPPKW